MMRPPGNQPNKPRCSNTGTGPSADLMPSIMGAFDAYIENNKSTTNDNNNESKIDSSSSPPPIGNSSFPRKTYQASSFAHLSPCVQKILSHVPDQELNRRFASEETLEGRRHTHRPIFRSMRSPEKQSMLLNKSTESLDIISPAVQKMISNFPDAELVFPTGDGNRKNPMKNSFLYTKQSSRVALDKQHQEEEHKCNNNASLGLGNGKTFVYHSDGSNAPTSGLTNGGLGSVHVVDGCSDGKLSSVERTLELLENKISDGDCDGVSVCSKPLGSYLHTSPHGIASRTPVGRKNLGKYLQVPSESSVGTTSSTTSSEVSRPVSLTSLGSCSSSGSSGRNMPGSAYLASAESLDSDPEPTGSQGSADSGIAEQPSMSPEARVLQEVLDTETVYVADLKDVIKGYLQPWKGDPDCPLAQHISHLFSNVEEICKFNSSFLEQLREAECDPTKTAHVFIQNDSGFSVYNEYCTNYPRTMEVIGELTRKEDMASLFRERQMALGHALPLGSYLLKPVQRILKYHLLLQRLSKQCEPQHKPTVDLALTTMTAVASDINNMKRKHEHAVRVHEIQSQLYGWTGPDLTTLGDLIAEGTFRVNGARGRRQVFLFEKVLLMAKPKQNNVFAYKSHIMCNNLMLVQQVRGEPMSFQVLPFDNPRLYCTLRARSPQHKREWTLQIKRVILENYSAVIPNHARQLVMQLGQDVQECEDTADKWSPLNKSSSPHYLERRSRVRKTRDFSSTLNNSRRASSQDRSFPTFGKWRRKSEPGMVTIPQYNVKTVPKKITKIKKAKGSGATFYTDLSDSETCETVHMGESQESLERTCSQTGVDTPDKGNMTPENHNSVENNLEKIVTDLLMQNQEFHKVMNRQNRPRNLRGTSEPEPVVWFDESRTELELPSKADSLPRSFQLNDQLETTKELEENQSQCGGDDDDDEESRKVNVDDSREEQPENDLSSQLIDDNDCPVNKIYRKSAIRLSLVQRIRALVHEETHHHKNDHTNSSGKSNKYTMRKLQGSKSMGEKIAHPDYADPQKLFVSSCNSSRTNLSVELPECEIMSPPEPLDMTINESEVLKEIDKRLRDASITTGKNCTKSSSSSNTKNDDSSQKRNIFAPTDNDPSSKQDLDNKRQVFVPNGSSQSSEGSCYYESILEKDLVEEYTKDENGRLVAKQDSFSKTRESAFSCVQKYKQTPQLSVFKETLGSSSNGDHQQNELAKSHSIKRPTKPPPPIPTKPARLASSANFSSTSSYTLSSSSFCMTNSKSSEHVISNQNKSVSTTTTNNATETITNSNLMSNSTSSCNKVYFENLSRTSQNGNHQHEASSGLKVHHQSSSSGSWVKTMVGRFE